ncbi:MAG: DUF378 domain-containing protein [Chlamydiia bacterium]|nr:DUF378 domain-containing protein [Chlamydiia bacterium]
MGKIFDLVASILLVVGGLNWFLVAFMGMNLVSMLFGASMLSQATYALVGAAAVWHGLGLLGISKSWGF